ncbi:MAG: hypothetical protein WAT39_20965 [Planctomycetota bacterium]
MSRKLFPFLLVTAAACTNYDFATARLPNGDYDHPKLIADLAASGQDELVAGTWIPLLWLDLVRFGPSDPGMPDGFTLKAVRGVGPLFADGHRKEIAVDRAGAWIDTQDRDWLLWGLLHHDHEDW